MIPKQEMELLPRGGDHPEDRRAPAAAGEDLERASALEHAGAWDSAADLYRRLYARSVERRDAGGMMDALYGQARMFRELQRLDEAEELIELCYELASRAGAHRIAARALNLRGVLRFSRGDIEGARLAYAKAAEQARDAGDDPLIAYACQNLGVLSTIRGELKEARALYLESVGASVRSGDRTAAAMVYNNLGMVSADLGEYLEAEVYFERGLEIAGSIPDLPMLARLYANRAEPMINVRDLERARGSLDRASELARRIGAASTLATVSRFRGMIAAAEGRLDEAERETRASLATAEAAGLRLARAEGLEALATILERLGRTGEAREALRQALQGYEALGAARDSRRLAERLA